MKVATRNNLIIKLTGTTWGANPQLLRTAAISLCYSAGEYVAQCEVNRVMRKRWM